jgi:hypothetical protein
MAPKLIVKTLILEAHRQETSLSTELRALIPGPGDAVGMRKLWKQVVHRKKAVTRHRKGAVEISSLADLQEYINAHLLHADAGTSFTCRIIVIDCAETSMNTSHTYWY